MCLLRSRRVRLNSLENHSGEAVVQPLVTGMEYTIDVVGSGSSGLSIIAPRKRLATDSGISMKGITAWNEEMVSWAGEIIKKLAIIGPQIFNVSSTEEGKVLFHRSKRPVGRLFYSYGRCGRSCLLECIVALSERRGTSEAHSRCGRERIMLRYWSEKYITIEEAQKFGWKNDA